MTPRRVFLLACLVMLVSVPGFVAASAAEEPDQLTVAITRTSPTVAQGVGNVSVGGVVVNPGRAAWLDVRAYISAGPQPLVTHGAVRAALARGVTDAGPRVTEPARFARLGTIRPGESRRFSITVRSRQLGMLDGDGVHPLGIQVLAARASDPDTEVPAGGAVTLLPVRADRSARPAPTTVLWPFLLPGKRLNSGAYADTSQLSASIAPGGQLRNLLDLALSTPRKGSDAVLDPSLLVELRALTRRPGNSKVAVQQRRTAAAFLSDLTDFAERYSCATVGYDRPDVVALASGPSTKQLNDIVEQATDDTLDGFDLDCLRIEWPTSRGVSRSVLNTLQRREISAVVVSPWAVPGWDSSRATLISRKSAAGKLPLIVDDRLDDQALGTPTIATLRQSILSEAVLSSISAGNEVAQTSTVTLVDPSFNPGRLNGDPLAAVYESDVTDPKNLAARVKATAPAYAGPVPDQAGAKPISKRLVTVAADAAQTARLLDGLLLDDADRTAHAQLVAALLSQRWRARTAGGLDAGAKVIDTLSAELASISVVGPEALTLSSAAGQFPVTVRNETPHRIRVALGVYASVPGVQFEAPATVDVAAGESRTVTVDIDMADQTAASVSVRLSSKEGLPFGASTVFNVRSSRVGAALWIAIGVSVAFVAIALLRRFARPGHRPSHPPLEPDDFDD